MIAYKVVRNMDGKKVSALAVGDMQVTYQIGEPSYPSPGWGGLYIFDNAAYAWLFAESFRNNKSVPFDARNLEVWECIVQPTKRPLWSGLHSWVTSSVTLTKQLVYGYVTMTDKLFSYWGRADGKLNRVIIECSNADELYTVSDNARRRPEMIRIHVYGLGERPPRCDPKTHYVTYVTLKEWKAWRVPQYDWK